MLSLLSGPDALRILPRSYFFINLITKLPEPVRSPSFAGGAIAATALMMLTVRHAPQ